MLGLFNSSTTRIRPAFKPREKTILCLTTLHHRRYVEDIIHAIALPAGSHLRLRYRKQYVSKALWQEITDNKSLKSSSVLIALAGSPSNGISDIAPIRKGAIYDSSCQGDLAVIDIVLLDYVFKSFDSQDVLQLLASKSTNLPNSANRDTSLPGTFLQRLTGAPHELNANSSVLGWERVSAAFFDIDKPQNTGGPCAPFLYHLGSLKNRVKSKLKKYGRLTISMGKQLQLEVHTIARPGSDVIRNPLGEVILDLSHGAAEFISSRRARADSSRDIKRIGIITTPSFSVVDGHLSIRTTIFKNKSDSSADSSITSPNLSPATSSTMAPALSSALPIPQEMISAEKRDEIVVARYDFPMRAGGYKPRLASAMVAAAAGLSVYKISSQGQFTAIDAVAPILVFLLTFFGLSLGIIKK